MDEKGYASYENFWKDYKPQLMLPTCRASRGDVPQNASVHRTARQYAGKQGPDEAGPPFWPENHGHLRVHAALDMRNFPFDTQGLGVTASSRHRWKCKIIIPAPSGLALRPPLHEPHTVDAEADLLPSNDIKLLYTGGRLRSFE